MGDRRATARRGVLRAAAGLVAPGLAGAAGCLDLGGPATVPGDEHPLVDEWLTETAVGGSDATYDGTILDARGGDELRVDVGVTGNGGTYAYDPSAAVVSPGTTVRWVWVDDREAHNVVAAPSRQLGESDYEFRSGGPVVAAPDPFVATLDRPGVALYHCEGIAGATARPGPPSGVRLGSAAGRTDRPTLDRRGSGAVLHLEPHLNHGMKGGIAVSE